MKHRRDGIVRRLAGSMSVFFMNALKNYHRTVCRPQNPVFADVFFAVLIGRGFWYVLCRFWINVVLRDSLCVRFFKHILRYVPRNVFPVFSICFLRRLAFIILFILYRLQVLISPFIYMYKNIFFSRAPWHLSKHKDYKINIPTVRKRPKCPLLLPVSHLW